jgi:hypothetical protein
MKAADICVVTYRKRSQHGRLLCYISGRYRSKTRRSDRVCDIPNKCGLLAARRSPMALVRFHHRLPQRETLTTLRRYTVGAPIGDMPSVPSAEYFLLRYLMGFQVPQERIGTEKAGGSSIVRWQQMYKLAYSCSRRGLQGVHWKCI